MMKVLLSSVLFIISALNTSAQVKILPDNKNGSQPYYFKDATDQIIILPGFQISLPKGNKVITLSQDNMPCIIPDMSQFNMPVLKPELKSYTIPNPAYPQKMMLPPTNEQLKESLLNLLRK